MYVRGDDGNEYDTYSALAGLQYYSEHAYTSEKEIDWDLFKRNFAGVCGGKLEDWIMASRLDMVPDATSVGERFPSNISKWILWQDPIYSFLSPQYQGLNLVPHFEFIREHLDTVSTQFLDLYPLNSRLQFPALLAKVIRDKAHLKKYLQKAYYSPHPKESLANLNQTLVIPLLASVNSLWKHHRDKIWLSTFKPFGLEILELRYGAIRTRLETLKDRLEAFCISDCHTDSIPELELDIHNEVYPGLGLDLVFDFARAYTPSRALGTG